MTVPGQPAYPHASPTGPRQPEHEIPMWVIWTAVALLLVGVAMVAAALLAAQGDDDERAYPATWDPRVVPYVQAVEKQRGLTFLHPVEVRFQAGPEFEKAFRADETKLDEKQRTEIEHEEGIFRALGLIKGDVDLFKAFNQTTTSATLAYYSYDDQRITVRGQQLALASHATLVHELTHALQDQRFGVGKRFDALDKEGAPSSSESDMLQAAVEGDAERTAQLYRSSLPKQQRRRLVAAEAAFEKKAGDAIPKNVPKVVLAYMGAPYALGQAMVDTVAQEGSTRAVDDLLTDTPTHDSTLLDPFEILSEGTHAKKVAAPTLVKGEKKFEKGEFGAVSWYLMLADRIPMRDALDAVGGWNGDAYVGFERAGNTCVRMNYVGADKASSMAMYTALVRWEQAVPGHPAKSEIEGNRITFEACDPGKKARGGSGSSTDALGLAVTRTYLALAMAKQGAPVKVARCLSGKMVDAFSLAQLRDQHAPDAATNARIAQMAVACR